MDKDQELHRLRQENEALKNKKREPIGVDELEEITKKVIEKARANPSVEEMLEALWERWGKLSVDGPETNNDRTWLVAGYAQEDNQWFEAPTLREAVEKAYRAEGEE